MNPTELKCNQEEISEYAEGERIFQILRCLPRPFSVVDRLAVHIEEDEFVTHPRSFFRELFGLQSDDYHPMVIVD